MIGGRTLRDAFISAANNIQLQRQTVDALNVFPVPDGDTGTNMSMTIGNAVRELKNLPDDVPASQVADVAASALLRGARGNSGVILSLLFRGFAKGLREKQTFTAKDVADAFARGVSAAYKAVMKPTEGTILTVARASGERAQAVVLRGGGLATLWIEVLKAAREALEKTPDQLPVLKKAGVVDAGGKGLVIILEGMDSVFRGDGIIPLDQDAPPPKPASTVLAAFDTTGGFDGQITFTYCTEFIVNREKAGRDPVSLRAYLESIGDCVVVVPDDEIIKVHVHTDNPGNAIQEALLFGSLSKVKIDNMREQFASAQQASAAYRKENRGEYPYAAPDPNRPSGFVAIAAGNGIHNLFRDLGVDQVVSGGQTMNPSTDDILSAIQATPAHTVFVLPNNKNIIMAAEQAARLADREVRVLQTMNIPQGMAAMLAYDADRSVSENGASMTQALERVSSGSVTFAARDSEYDGHHIHKGELLALDNGRLAFSDSGLEKTLIRLVRSMLKKDTAFVTVLYGEDIAEEQAQDLETALREKIPADVELSFISGGQPVYYFLISVE